VVVVVTWDGDDAVTATSESGAFVVESTMRPVMPPVVPAFVDIRALTINASAMQSGNQALPRMFASERKANKELLGCRYCISLRK
jgi:hypothetical protein